MHELAGVVAASNAMGADVAAVAVVTKLVRVCMLEPWLLLLYYNKHRLGLGSGKLPGGGGSSGVGNAPAKGRGVPWFALGFAGVAALNSAVGFGPGVTGACGTVSGACLAAAMAALGLDTDLAKVKALGAKPALLAFVLWVNLLVVGGAVAHFLSGWLL